ncbi:MAG: hypothetical protein ACKO23_20955 [Gemmataceae bacterium]
MNSPRWLTLSLLLVSGLTMAVAQERTASPTDGYPALVEEYQKALAAYQ